MTITAVRSISGIDISIATFVVCVGVLALNTARNIWMVRNGGLLLRAVVVKLAAFGVWSFLIFGSTLFEWGNRDTVSVLSQWLANLDRLILSVPMAVLLIWALPSISKTK